MRRMPARHSAGIEAAPSVGRPATGAGHRSSSAGGVSRTVRTTTSGGGAAFGALPHPGKVIDSSSPVAAHTIVLDCRIGRLHSVQGVVRPLGIGGRQGRIRRFLAFAPLQIGDHRIQRTGARLVAEGDQGGDAPVAPPAPVLLSRAVRLERLAGRGADLARLGQQQGVWRFPEQFLSGIGYGYLKLDIVLVYMVSTFAVTASGAAVLAATEELLARTAAAGRPTDGLTLSDVLGYIWTRKLEVEGEGDALGYACSCTLAGCTLDDMPEVAAAAGVTLEPSSDGR